MDRPPLNAAQTEAALNAYYSAREQAVRYVLGALDPAAYNAPALPYAEVLERVQAILATEREHYTEAARVAAEAHAAEEAARAAEAPELPTDAPVVRQKERGA